LSAFGGFDSAESFDSKLTTEGLVAGCGSVFDTAELVAGCGSFVLKSIKRSVINIGRSTLDVRRSILLLFRPGEVLYERRRWPRASSQIEKETTFL
jgi:hypothetical protein